MTFLVAYDGSPLATAALRRAVAFAQATDESVTAVTVVRNKRPDDAIENGWLDPNGDWQQRTVLQAIEAQVDAVSGAIDTEIRLVDRYASAGTIAREIIAVAQDVDASVVFIGSDNAGRLVIPVTSVAGNVAGTDARWDVHIVRHERPAPVSGLED